MKTWNFWDGIFVCVAVVLISFSITLPLKNYNNQALFYMLKKKPLKAEKKWRQSLSQQPFFPLYRMNLALLYLSEEQTKKAFKENKITQDLLHLFQIDKIKTYNFTLDKDRLKLTAWPKFFWKKTGTQIKDNKLIKQILRKRIFFNSALMATQKGDIEEALNFYQKALQFEPESLKIKTNIELLMAQVQNNEDKESKEEKNQDSKNSEENSEENSDKKEQGEQNQKDAEEQAPEDNKQGEPQKQDEASEDNKQGEPQKQDEASEEDKNQGAEKKEKGSEEEDKTPEDNQQGEPQKQDEAPEEDKAPEEENKGRSKEQDKAQAENNMQKNKEENQKEEDKKQGRGTSQRAKQNWNKQQTEAVLKSILEQEKKIQERRNREKKRPNRVEKDW